MLWHELSWPQLEKIDKNTPVLIPLGSCEQHGHHLPVFVDTIQVTAIAEAVEERLREGVLLLPTLWLGSSHHHLDFSGTVSVLPSLYSGMIKSMTRCILEAGFKRLLFLNGHGGNKVPASQALSELVCENDEADNAYLVLSTWWELNPDALNEGMESEGISHACEYETSLTLALRPDLVALDRIREGKMALDNEWTKSEGLGGRVAVFRRFRRLTAAGSMGRPSSATPEKGNRILETVTSELVGLLQDLSKWPELPPLGPDSNW